MGASNSHLAESPRELLVIFGGIFFATYILTRRLSGSYSGRKLPPAMSSLPIVGSIPFLPTTLKDLLEFCISSRNKLGKIFSFRLGSKSAVLICGKEAIHEALVIKSVDFADRPDFFQQLPKGIAMCHYDPSFRNHHKLCMSIMKRFGYGNRVMETRILREVEEMINKVREKEGRPFDVVQLTASCMANVVMGLSFGRRFDHSDPTFQQFLSDAHDFLENFSAAVMIFPVMRFIPRFRKMLVKYMRANEGLLSFVSNNIAACTQNETEVESFVGDYIDARGSDYDQEQLLWTCRDIALAGAASPTTFIRWAIVLLTNHVSVQERLRAEIDSVIGRQRPPTLDDRSDLPYVEATILELLRYKTPLAIAHRALNDTEVGGYFIPGGTTVFINLNSAHMDPGDWQQPQQFRPERFLDESGNVVGRDRIIPFSLGKRSCFGQQLARQEIFLFLVALLQNFYFKPPEGQDNIDVHEVWAAGATIVPSDYKVRMIAREA